jgi:hypothetical protein
MTGSLVAARNVVWTAALALLLSPGAAIADDCNDVAQKCKIEVHVDGTCPNATFRFVPETLKLRDKHKWQIIWTLPTNYKFCPASGDRLIFKDYTGNPDFQFYTQEVDDPSGNCYLKLSVWDKNEPWTSTKQYSYFLQFTSPTNTTCKFDPFIRNG